MKTIQQVANELGVKYWHIRHAFDGGYVEKPTIFSGRFVFTEQDVQNLRTYFSSRKETENDASSKELVTE
jgi:predicted site-specific integrase-resolvase